MKANKKNDMKGSYDCRFVREIVSYPCCLEYQKQRKIYCSLGLLPIILEWIHVYNYMGITIKGKLELRCLFKYFMDMLIRIS